MVLPLKEIIYNDDNKTLSSERIKVLDKVFSSFKCSQKNQDVEKFITELAIEFEKKRISSTFLIFNDEELEKGNLVLDAFFSLALKVFEFSDEVSKSDKKKACTNEDSTPAYLIGQLARSVNTKSGLGKEALIKAIEYIKGAQYYVGGRLVYLDCRDDLVKYYEKQGFKFIQKRKSPDENGDKLNQMYIII